MLLGGGSKGSGKSLSLPATTSELPKLPQGNNFIHICLLYIIQSLPYSLFNQNAHPPILYEEILDPDATLPACTVTLHYDPTHPHSLLLRLLIFQVTCELSSSSSLQEQIMNPQSNLQFPITALSPRIIITCLLTWALQKS